MLGSFAPSGSVAAAAVTATTAVTVAAVLETEPRERDRSVLLEAARLDERPGREHRQRLTGRWDERERRPVGLDHDLGRRRLRRLTSDQEKRLAALLARIDLASLPEQLGGVPQPNAHQITVSCGRMHCVLNLPPAGGGAEPRHATADPLAASVLELGEFMKNMIGI